MHTKLFLEMRVEEGYNLKRLEKIAQYIVLDGSQLLMTYAPSQGRRTMMMFTTSAF